MHLRQNVVTREWVLFAPERARRPEDYHRLDVPRTDQRPAFRADCPFCPGHDEDITCRLGDGDGGHVVQTFPNKFPAVLPDEQVIRSGDAFHRQMGALGYHEVCSESPAHNTTLALMPAEQVRRVLEAWQQRVRWLRALPQTDLVVVYKNHGEVAGTSLEHPHSQIVSLPVAPWQVRHRAEEALRYYDDQGECVFCGMLKMERAERVRVVAGGRHATAVVPYATYSPFSMWVLPHRHDGCLSTANSDELDDLAVVLRDVLARLYRLHHDPAYNLVVRLAPRDTMSAPYVHWYMAIVPRLTKSAGFELGTGMFINPSLPEDDAEALRTATESSSPAPTE